MASLFTSVQKQVAHSSKLQGIGKGNLSDLGDVIASEKGLLSTSQRLSADIKKSAEALRAWGTNEAQGDDLHDILSKVSFLFEQLSNAERRYADHVSNYRVAFKTLRTREEDFLEMQKRKANLQSKIETADKQLAKTSMEHKERPSREQRLDDLHAEMGAMDTAVLQEDAKLSDFKRTTVREALGLKLGAMLEVAEKTSIVAEMCKLLIAEVPRDVTQPGHPRAPFTGQAETARVMEEANRCLHAVVFSGDALLPADYGDGLEGDTSIETNPRGDAGSHHAGHGGALAPPAETPGALAYPSRPSRSRVSSYDQQNERMARQKPSRTYSRTSLGKSATGRSSTERTSAVGGAGGSGTGASTNHTERRSIDQPPLHTPPIVSHDYAAAAAPGAAGAAPAALAVPQPAVHPAVYKEAQIEPRPPVKYDSFRSDRQSFPASVHGNDPNRSSLAYMTSDDSSKSLARPQPPFAAAPPPPQPPSKSPSAPSATSAPAARDARGRDGYDQYTYEHTAASYGKPGREPAGHRSPQISHEASLASSNKSPPMSPRPAQQAAPRNDVTLVLGSKHGFDAPVYGQTTEAPASPRRRESIEKSGAKRNGAPSAPPAGYSYHRANDSSGRVNAGAFRRAGNSATSSNSYSSTQPSAISPAAQIRDSYLARAYIAPPDVSVDAEQPEPITAPLRLGARGPDGPQNGRRTPVQSSAPVDGFDSSPPLASAPPPLYTASTPTASKGGGGSGGGGSGFQANRFVTRLD